MYKYAYIYICKNVYNTHTHTHTHTYLLGLIAGKCHAKQQEVSGSGVPFELLSAYATTQARM